MQLLRTDLVFPSLPAVFSDAPHQIKAQIRELVFSGLSDRNRKIRLACVGVVFLGSPSILRH